ncbi:hypothetical protein ABVT39_026006 [Epinephelus coioides]
MSYQKKPLKSNYRRIKDHNGQSGASRKSWRWFEAMDAIYGHSQLSNQNSTQRNWKGSFNGRCTLCTLTTKKKEKKRSHNEESQQQKDAQEQKTQMQKLHQKRVSTKVDNKMGDNMTGLADYYLRMWKENVFAHFRRRVLCYKGSDVAVFTQVVPVVAVGEEEEEQVVEEIPSTSGTDPSVPSAPSGSRVRGGGRVLTDRVLETQRETISAIREVRDELTQIRMVMQNMCELISSATDAIKRLQK